MKSPRAFAAISLLLLVTSQSFAQKQAAVPPLSSAVISVTVHSAIDAELAMVDRQGIAPLRYRITKRDAKGTTVRDVINTRQGPVTRLRGRDGHPLDQEADSAERARLQDMLDSPSIMERHAKTRESERKYSSQLLQALPDALLFTPSPGQPQTPGAPGPETVLDFAPNPNFHPASTVTEGLSNIEGRVWLDTASGHMVRLEGRIRAATDFRFGILARIYPGGTVLFQQQPLDQNHWVFSHLDSHLVIRELLLHKQAEDTTLDYTSYTALPASLDWRQAVNMLLQENPPSR